MAVCLSVTVTSLEPEKAPAKWFFIHSASALHCVAILLLSCYCFCFICRYFSFIPS